MHELPIIYREDFYLPFGKAHVFPGIKYKLIYERLLSSGAVRERSIISPEKIEIADVLRVHESGYVERLTQGTLSTAEIRRMELPYSTNIVAATLIGCGGTLATARRALEDKAAVCIGGGFHHAHPDHGEGFCMLHDVAIALRRLRSDGLIRTALVIDLDVHHGNGTAAIFPPALNKTDTVTDIPIEAGVLTGPRAPSPDEVFTLSLHQKNLYPGYKPPSSIDVHIRDGVGDSDYLAALELSLSIALASFQPDIIAYIAGSDPYLDDKLGGLSLTIDGLRRRDEIVFSTADRSGIPIFSVFAGGYARLLEDTVTIHANTILAAQSVFLAG